jgi:hypothetical protein
MAFSAVSHLPSTDLTSDFNELLQKHGAAPGAAKAALDIDVLEGFIKEAYRIVSPTLKPKSA